MLAIELAEEDRQDKAMEAFIIWFTLLSLLDLHAGCGFVVGGSRRGGLSPPLEVVAAIWMDEVAVERGFTDI